LKERRFEAANLNSSSQLRRLKRPSGISRYAGLFLAFAGAHASVARGQALPAATTRFSGGIIATVGGMNTQLPYYADNALGYNFGLYLQPFSVLGVEIRGGAYPVWARFKQTPVTAGIRLERREPFMGHFQPFAYLGGGFSRAQGSSTSYRPIPAIWSPCWQISEGIEVPLGRIKWRAFEATWAETYTNRRNIPRRQIRGLSLSTGLVYSF